ncbi:dhhc zinc finger domain containing protein [Stylonychia lemnae]|uniref:Palmitoyltransferase n=1 Tax=Stylonychia lemnae TaxID=5949 RepID=A0A077ZTZ0_STYLE|nr:dhhc zinc finger domain containing protein [Stylonychia lemnae]|eukprot:CDW73363.1 dhhc zinc finger domain containing protein [Stylonychia lemnae]
MQGLAGAENSSDTQSAVILQMEKKLNPSVYWRRFWKHDKYCMISSNQYWDWLTYIDDDYLTEWEVLKMKELYFWQLQEMSGQAVCHVIIGWGLTFPLMGPIVKSSAHGWYLRMPVAMTFATFLSVQASNWQRPSKTFHEIMAQPAPHGGYLRKTLKEHFPVWWYETSSQLAENGYSLPEMNEYDKATIMPHTHTKFDIINLMSSILDRLADMTASPMFSSLGLFIRIIGPIFVMTFYALLSVHVFAYYEVILTVLKKRLGVSFGLLWIGIGVCILYNIVFNHFFAMVIKPGSPTELKEIERMRKELKDRESRTEAVKTVEQNGKIKYVEDDRYEGVSKDVKKLLRYRSKTVSQLEACWAKKCSSCDFIKPIRTYHCSVCDKCIFLMDHHSPWVNNCLGLENYRYYLLFNLYLLVGLCFNLITIFAIWNHHVYRDNSAMMNFIIITDAALAMIVGGFNAWNWFMAMSGQSTVEMWATSYRGGVTKYDFYFRNIQDNLYKIFGTYNPFAILSPSFRNVPFTGIEWSFQLRDLGYNEKGEQGKTNFDEEESIIEDEVQDNSMEMTTVSHRSTAKDTLDSIDSSITL